MEKLDFRLPDYFIACKVLSPEKEGVICTHGGAPMKFRLESVQAIRDSEFMLFVGVFIDAGGSKHVFTRYHRGDWHSLDIPSVYLKPFDRQPRS